MGPVIDMSDGDIQIDRSVTNLGYSDFMVEKGL